MIRIICDKCKNAYLQKEGDGFVCPSCNAEFPLSAENLLLGVQYYNEQSYESASDYLMKTIVSDGESYRALFYKALCDGFMFDEDTYSLDDVYKKLKFAFEIVPGDEFVRYLKLVSGEIEKIERAVVEEHVAAFETADAEKIKKEVAFILKIQEEAAAFRLELSHITDTYNETAAGKVSVNFSKCHYVTPEMASDVGDKKLAKIKEDISTHTVFTGILTSDIKNLEIYYRCIAMFFESSKSKYDFLLESGSKFATLSEALDIGGYTTVTGTKTTAEKLKITAYSFFEDSLKEHEDEKVELPTVIEIETEPEAEEIAEEAAEEVAKKAAEEVSKEVAEEVTEEVAEEAAEEAAEEVTEEAAEEVAEEAAEEVTEEVAEETAEEVTEEFSEEVIVEEIIEETAAETASNEETFKPSDEIFDEIPEQNDTIVEEFVTVEKPSGLENVEVIEPDEVEATEDNSNCEKTDEEKTEAVNEEVVTEKQTTLKPKKKKHTVLIIVLVLLIAAAGFFAYKYLPGIINESKYKTASELRASKKYDEAVAAFEALGEYEDSTDKAKECSYESACALVESEKFAEARVIFESLGDYKDCATKISLCKYSEAEATLESGNFDEASKLFTELGEYGNSADMIKECSYRKAASLVENKEYESAVSLYKDLGKYSDSAKKILEAKYLYVTENLSAKDKLTVQYIKELASVKYRNSVDLKKQLGLDNTEVSTVSVVVNTSPNDSKTSVTSVKRSETVYCHFIVKNADYYGKKLTATYKTQYGYSQSETLTFTKTNTSGFVIYPSTQYSNYTVTFTLTDSSGKTLGKQTITIT